MSALRPLGNLTYLRVWHDNTGRGNYASWHCMAVLVRDVQTNERFEFIANRWFATEKEDGQVSSETKQVRANFFVLMARNSHAYHTVYCMCTRDVIKAALFQAAASLLVCTVH